MKVIHLARKPLSEPNLAANVLRWGTGGINIDRCRIHGGPSEGGSVSGASALGQGSGWNAHVNRPTPIDRSLPQGRWPANVIIEHRPGCRSLGTRPDTPYRINRWDDGAKPFGGGAGHPFSTLEHPVGETEIWECELACGGTALVQQGGYTGGGQLCDEMTPTTHDAPVKFAHSPDRHQFTYGDEGSPARYFLQIQREPEVLRAHHEAVCEACGKPYIDHPEDGRHPYLNVLCDGTRVKL